jgi:hypothetical protein
MEWRGFFHYSFTFGKPATADFTNVLEKNFDLPAGIPDLTTLHITEGLPSPIR